MQAMVYTAATNAANNAGLTGSVTDNLQQLGMIAPQLANEIVSGSVVVRDAKRVGYCSRDGWLAES